MRLLWYSLAAALRLLGEVLRAMGDLPRQIDAGLQSLVRRPPQLGASAPVRPADVNHRLKSAMLAPANFIEDAKFQKIAPNDFVVELAPPTYERYYRPIERQLCEQWQRELIEVLNTTNQRLGRREYRFAGPVRVRIRPVAGLNPGEVRLEPLVAAEAEARPQALAYLELLPGGRQWRLGEGVTTLGRDPGCDVHLDMPRFRHQPLVSGQHAYVVGQGGQFRLFDGSPKGRPSRNGTFVNGQPVSAGGHELHDGDMIVLAALNPLDPRPDRPGVATFFFVKPK